MTGEVRVGTSGWSYPSGRGTWNGIFYPPSARGFDELAYYAEHFDTVEVNSTFYRLPRPETSRSWARRTPPGFEFSIKLYQGFTHPSMAPGGTAVVNPDNPAIPVVGEREVKQFQASVEPLAGAGKLGALLVQFPPSFKQSPASLDYLAWLLGSFAQYSPAVELRHQSWSDGLAATLRLLDGFKAAWVQIDEPKFRFSVRQNRLPNVTGFYYMRLHGRNAEKWWRHEKSEDRYDYLYSPAELKPFAETATAVRSLVRKAYLYLNNHFAAKSVADAVELKYEIGEPIGGRYRRELLDAYPFLKEIRGLAVEAEPAKLKPRSLLDTSSGTRLRVESTVSAPPSKAERLALRAGRVVDTCERRSTARCTLLGPNSRLYMEEMTQLRYDL